MSSTAIREILAAARRSDSAGGGLVTRTELQQAWAEALRPEPSDGEGRPISEGEAEIFYALPVADLSRAARRLLRDILDTRIPSLRVQQAPASGSRVIATLSGVEQKTVELLENGALRRAETAGSDPLVESAAVLSLAQIEKPDNPFAPVRDADMLKKVFAFHRRLYEQIKRGERLAQETPYGQRHARAALLAIMRLAAERLFVLRPDAARALVPGLVELASHDPHIALRKFEVYRLLATPAFKDVPAVKAAEAVVFPVQPPYEAWRQDGVLRVQLYCDDDGASWMSQVYILEERLGMRVTGGSKDDPDQPVVFSKKVGGAGGGFERLEVILAPRPKKDAVPSLFEKMGDDTIDIIIYSGHAGYGQRVDAALRAGVQTTGAGKLIMLFQCSGYWNLDSIGRAFPEAQLFSTIDSSTAWTDDPTTAATLDGFAGGKSWPQILDGLGYRAERPKYDWDGLYFAPSTRPIIERHFDLDQDGQPEFEDRVYLEPSAQLLRHAATGFNAINQRVPAYTLDAGGLQTAVRDTSLILGYNDFGLSATPPGFSSALELKPDLVVNGGFYTPEPGDHAAFRIEPVAIGGKTKLRVRLNAQFAHAEPEELKNFLAFELGQQIALWAGKRPEEALAYAMAFYLQSLYQHKSQWENYALLDDEVVEHRLFLERYGLGALPFAEFLHSLEGDHPSFTAASLAEFLRKTTAWAAGKDGAPRQIGQPLAIVDTASLYEGSDYDTRISPEKMEWLVRTFPRYSNARVLTIAPRDYWSSGPRVVQIEVDGRRLLLVVEINKASGKPVAAHDLGGVIDLRSAALESIADARKQWAAQLWTQNAEENSAELLRMLAAEVRGGGTLLDMARKAAAHVERTGGDKSRLVAVFGYSGGLLRDAYPAQEVEAMDAYIR